ncbi:peroxiredoxin [Rubricella aquisinus]|uniref:Peroxiredoxin n=1 Tax=Rubricella aquisinus TaxID=2028108 RepID=A0A840X691_9RHOB|nr:thioredoxin family protein [Rubricella aquisinus]MBB5516227.1 peroxiredoxin [Rubricella aquisinus]
MPAIETPQEPLGWAAPEFSLPDPSGQVFSLGDLRGVRGLVVFFICNHCPYVKAIADRLTMDAQVLLDLGYGVVAISSNDVASYPEDSPENMAVFAEEHAFPFPYLYDEDQSAAKAFGAVCTPDIFGFDAMLKLRYRGRLDASGREAAPDAPRELIDAMRHVYRTGRGPEVQHPSIGCSIKWKD